MAVRPSSSLAVAPRLPGVQSSSPRLSAVPARPGSAWPRRRSGRPPCARRDRRAASSRRPASAGARAASRLDALALGAAALERLEQLLVGGPRSPRPRRPRRARPRAAAPARRRACGLGDDLVLVLAGDLQVGLARDALVGERVQHAAPTSRARAPRPARRARRPWRCGDGGVERRLAELGLDLRARSPRDRRSRMSSRSSSSVSKPASAAKSSSSSGSSLSLTSLTVTANSACLPARSSAPVVVGEGDLDRALLAGRGAHELLLEAGDRAGPRRARRIWSRPSPPSNGSPSSRADEVDHDEVALGGRALDGLERARAARAAARARLSIALVVDARPRGGRPRGPCSRRARPSGARRSRSRSAAARPRRAGRRGRARARRRGRRRRRRSPRRTSRQRLAHRLVEHRLAADALDHDAAAGTLPLRKPGMLSSRPSCRAARGDALLDLVGGHLGLDAHARLGQLGDGGVDGGWHEGADDTVAPWCAFPSPQLVRSRRSRFRSSPSAAPRPT